VREVTVPRFANNTNGILIVLEDVQVDGKVWKSYIPPVNVLGKGGFGGFGKGKGGKGGGAPDPKNNGKNLP
jgi:hypothetical protein